MPGGGKGKMRTSAIVALAAALLLGGYLAAQFHNFSARADERAAALPLEKMREFSEIFKIVKDHYVDEISDQELMENAIRGMVQGLDPHSAYFSEKNLASFEKSIRAEEYGGVGIFIGQKDGWVEVISPIGGGPAARAGMDSGDLILKIDGTATNKMRLDEASERMRGKIGNVVTLEVLTRGDEGPRSVELRREKITAPTAVAALAEPDFGYLRLSRFQQQTVEDAIRSVNKLYADNGRPLRGLILDLRNNPGGLLDVSIGFASIFLPDGAAVVSDRSRRADHEFKAGSDRHEGLQHEADVKSVRIVALVNGGSASASEIVAGALQDHKRAVIMGEPTYGKASVQSLMRLISTKQKTGLKLTTARYFTPSGRSIQAVGIEPDIAVESGASFEPDSPGFALREENLARHLENTQQSPTNAEAEEDGDNIPFIPRNDHQYDQALVVLKALTVAGS